MRINMLCCLLLAIFLVVWGSDQKATASESIIPGPASPGGGALRSITERNVDATVHPLFMIRWMGHTTSNGDAGAGEHTHSPQFLRIMSLLELSSGDRVVFLRNGMVADSTAYTIVDPTLVKTLWELFTPQQEVNRRLEELSRRPNELDRLTEEQAEYIAALKALFEEQNRLNDEAQTKARALLDEAVTSGAAKPIDP
jgi:hypothetical protein